MGKFANQVKDIVVNVLKVDESEVTDDTSFLDLGADELDVEDVMNEFSKVFKINIPTEQINLIKANMDFAPVGYMYGAIIGPHLYKIIASYYDLDLQTLINSGDFDFMDIGDELDCVEVIMEFEKYFKISIPDEDASNIYSLSDAIFYLAGRL